jgi:hypothetical protein
MGAADRDASLSGIAISNNFMELLPRQTFVNALGEGYAPDTARLPICRTTNYNDPRTLVFTLTYRQ